MDDADGHGILQCMATTKGARLCLKDQPQQAQSRSGRMSRTRCGWCFADSRAPKFFTNHRIERSLPKPRRSGFIANNN